MVPEYKKLGELVAADPKLKNRVVVAKVGAMGVGGLCEYRPKLNQTKPNWRSREWEWELREGGMRGTGRGGAGRLPRRVLTEHRRMLTSLCHCVAPARFLS